MELKTNENKIKLSGVANIPTGLKNGNSYDITIADAEVHGVNEIPNHDGTKNVIFSLKISELSSINIISDKGVTPAKKQGSQARVLRRIIESIAKEQGEDVEQFYQKRMSELINQEKED